MITASKNLTSIALGMALIVASNNVAASLSDGLVAYYAFEGTANDISGNNHHGIVSGGATYATGVIGQGIVLDGVNDYLTVNVPIIGSGNWTVSAWVNIATIDSGYTDWQELISNNAESIALGFETSNRRLAIWDSGNRLMSSNNTISAGINTLITYVKSGNNLSIYKDGISIAENSNGAAIAFSTLTTIGMWLPGDASAFNREALNGMIDDLRIYNRALSSAEITTLHAVPVPSAVWLFLGGMATLLRMPKRSALV